MYDTFDDLVDAWDAYDILMPIPHNATVEEKIRVIENYFDLHIFVLGDGRYWVEELSL